jgi:Ca-activated chloride channel family protein
MMNGWEWAQPQWFWLLILLLPMAAAYWWKRPSSAFIKMPVENISSGKIRTLKTTLRNGLPLLRISAFAAIIMALARPQTMQQKQTIQSEGIDILIVLDISGSMLTTDFAPNRLEAAKAQAEKFIDGRPNDRIGLVVFASNAYTACPVTIDHAALKKIMSSIKSSQLADATAVGMGLGTAVNRLQSSNGKSKVIILMTDGESNTGEIDPLTSADLAMTLGIRVFTIDMEPHQDQGHSEVAPPSGSNPTGERLLQQIAANTGGIYYHASDDKKLAAIYSQLDQLMKTKMDVATFKSYNDHFFPFLWFALFALLFEMFLRYTFFKTIT